eukprot:2472160-Amphidinium_carterae.1
MDARGMAAAPEEADEECTFAPQIKSVPGYTVYALLKTCRALHAIANLDFWPWNKSEWVATMQLSCLPRVTLANSFSSQCGLNF